MHADINIHQHDRSSGPAIFVVNYFDRSYLGGQFINDDDKHDVTIDEFLNKFFEQYPRALDRIVKRVHHAAGVASVVHDAANGITYPLNDAIATIDALPAFCAEPASDALTVEKLRGQIDNLSHRLHMVERVVLQGGVQ